MKDSKKIYKMTYSVRLPSFKKGSFFIYENLVYYINSVHGNKMKVINLSSWEELSFDFKNIKNAKIIGGEEQTKKVPLVEKQIG